MYGAVLGKSWQLRPQMFNPEHWDEIRQLLLNYGGEEPDDYIETVGERRMMEAVARYIYWLSHLGTAFFQNSVVSKLIQGIASGTSPVILYGMAVKHAVEHKRIITGYFKDMHTLALVTEHLPVGSVVLTFALQPISKDTSLRGGKRSIGMNSQTSSSRYSDTCRIQEYLNLLSRQKSAMQISTTLSMSPGTHYETQNP